MREGDDHVFALDQVFIIEVRTAVDDFRPARGCELFLDLEHFVADDFLNPRAGAQDIKKIGKFRTDLLQFVIDFVAAESGQALEPQVEVNKPR